MKPSEYIEKHGWTQRTYENPKCERCMAGAVLLHPDYDDDNSELGQKLENFRQYCLSLGTNIAIVNDSPAFSKELAIINLRNFGL